MNAALIRLREEVRILGDNIRHLVHGGEPKLSLYERNDLICQMRADIREIEHAIEVLVVDERMIEALRVHGRPDAFGPEARPS